MEKKKYASTWIWLIANDMKGKKKTCAGDISCKMSSFNCSIVFTWWYEFFLPHLVLLKFILPLINLAATIAKAQKTGDLIISPNPISLLFWGASEVTDPEKAAKDREEMQCLNLKDSNKILPI